MANVKISALPTASTPLAGTELVPIVQSGVTSQTTTGAVVAPLTTSLAANSGSSLVGYLPSGTGAVATTVQAKLRETVNALDYMPVGSTDISIGINNALTANTGKALTILVSVPPNGGYWNWSTQIDLGTSDSWVSLIGDGFVPCKASATLNSFVVIGKSNKNNMGKVSGFSFNAGNYNHGSAIIIGASRSFTVSDIELKADGTGKFTDGIVFDESVNTSGETGSGYELNIVQNIVDSGDSAVTGSMVRYKYGSARSVTVNNIRATRNNFTAVVSNDSGVTVAGGQISNILATFITARPSACNALVALQGNIANLSIFNISSLDGTATPSCNYAVSLTSAGAGCATNYYYNSQVLVNNAQYNIDSTAPSQYINLRPTNAGKPDEQGAMYTNPKIRIQGGVVLDTVNQVLWAENSGAFTAAFDRRYSQINNDGVFSVDVGTTTTRTYGGLFSLAVEGSAASSGIVFWRTNTASVCSQITASANLATTTGVLTGTTGTAGKVTVSTDTATGKIYIENRTGAGRRFHIAFI